jgi:hypothetical protein
MLPDGTQKFGAWIAWSLLHSPLGTALKASTTWHIVCPRFVVLSTCADQLGLSWSCGTRSARARHQISLSGLVSGSGHTG